LLIGKENTMKMTNVIHKDLFESGKWFDLSYSEQMANIGCDVERTIQWRKAGAIEESKQAFYRALELLDFSKADPKNRGENLLNLCRIREFLVDHFLCDNEYSTTDEFWQQYFYEFNYVAALQRRK
jgi:hypothetical protein